VMRIGGDSMIHVDIRIIAATHQELWKRVEEGRFRADLYYRLRVLPVQVPPLRARRGDILFLLEHFRRGIGAAHSLAPEAAEMLSRYPWPGNVRELKNCAEYLAYLDKPVIEARDLAPILQWPETARRPADPALADFARAIGVERDCCLFLLEALRANQRDRLRSGRRSLYLLAQERGLFLSEAQIRKALIHSERFGLVRMRPGRGGTSITPAGIEALERLRGQDPEIP